MELEDQVCSFEQSKKLFELGILLPSAFSWCERKDSGANHLVKNHVQTSPEQGCRFNFYSAYTVAELGILLGKHQTLKCIECWQICECYTYPILTFGMLDSNNFSEAQARADALIWLIKNEYIKPGDLKL